jgi:hypothetical protein
MNDYVKKVRAIAKREYELGDESKSDCLLMEGFDDFISIKDAPLGKVGYMFGELDDGSLNATGVVAIDNEFGRAVAPMGDITSKFFYLIERRSKNGWEEVPNEEALQPVELLEKGVLKENDIIRFRGVDGSIASEVETDEELLLDLNGLFYIGVQFDEFSDYVNSLMEEALDDDEDDDDDCDCGHDHTSEPRVEIISASNIIEYLRKNGSVIKAIGEEIDAIEAEEE